MRTADSGDVNYVLSKMVKGNRYTLAALEKLTGFPVYNLHLIVGQLCDKGLVRACNVKTLEGELVFKLSKPGSVD